MIVEGGKERTGGLERIIRMPVIKRENWKNGENLLAITKSSPTLAQMEYNRGFFIWGRLTNQQSSARAGNRNRIQQPRESAYISTSVYIVPKAMPRMVQYLRGYWLKKFPYHLPVLSK